MTFFEAAEVWINTTFVVGAILATIIVGVVLVICSMPATSVPSAATGPTTRRFTHAEARELVKTVKQLKEQQGKLIKNLENREEENKKLRQEGSEKDRLVKELRKQLTEALHGRRHAVCIDRLAYEKDLRRGERAIHAEQIDQLCKRHAKEMAEEKTRANDDYRKVRGQLEHSRKSAWVEVDKVTDSMSILEVGFAQREADLTSENTSLRSQLRIQEVETENCNNRNAVLRRQLELKGEEFAEQSYVLANVTRLLREKTASASAELSAKEKLTEALAQVEQAGNDKAEELRNSLASIKQLEDDKTVLLKERYPSKPQAPEQEDTDMVDVDIDIEDVEMTDAFA